MQTVDGAKVKSVHLLDVRIDCIQKIELLEGVVRSVQQRRQQTILYVNAHCMNVQYKERAYHDILAAAGIVYCDGIGVLLGARLIGQTIPERITGADWIDDLCQTATQHNLSLFLLGGDAETVHGAAAVLRARHPRLRIVGAKEGYEIGADTIAEINERRPDILLVGMGTPRQEKWIARHRSALDVPVVWAVGGLFDLVSGRIPRGPRWMTQHGLEWLCRLAVEPGRLWRRYLLGNPRFLWRVVTTHAMFAVLRER